MTGLDRLIRSRAACGGPGDARRAAVLAVLVTVLAGCSAQHWRRFFYDVGDQYACKQQNEGRHDESNRDAECTDPSRPGRKDFDEYEQVHRDEGV